MKSILIYAIFSFSLNALCISNALADLIFSSYNGNGSGVSSSINSEGAINSKAVAFTMPDPLLPSGTTDYLLDTIQVYLTGTATSDRVILGLYDNDGVNTPGALISSFTAASSFTLNATVTAYTFLPNSSVLLEDGTTYWVALSAAPGVSSFGISWRTSSPQPSSYSSVGVTYGGNVFGASTNPSVLASVGSSINAMSINATVVPEPSTLALVAAGSFLVMFRRRFYCA